MAMNPTFHPLRSTLVAAAAVFGMATAGAAPTLVGDSVTATFSGNFNASASAVVALGGSPEFTQANLSPLDIVGEFIDIGPTSITLNLLNGYFDPQLIVISGLDFLSEPAEVAGATLSSNSIAWLTAGMISFTSSSVTINVGTGIFGGGRAVIDLATRSTGTVSAPGTLALAGLGLLAAGAMRRRQTA